MDRALTRAATAFVKAAARAGLLLLVVAASTFLLTALLPGDAAGHSLAREADAAGLARARAELGEDRPVLVRLGSWLRGVAGGDLGRTAQGRQVTEVIGEPLLRTLALGGAALGIVALVGVSLGTLLAYRAGTPADRAAAGVLAALVGFPEFVVASVLVLVTSVWLDLVPPVVVPRGDGTVPLSMFVVPVLALALPSTAWTVRATRGAVLDALVLPHVEAARLDGLNPVRVAFRHALPAASPSLAAVVATMSVTLLGGAVVVERFVNYPGLGSVLAAAVEGRDVPLASGCVLAVASVVIAVFAAADLARSWARPA